MWKNSLCPWLQSGWRRLPHHHNAPEGGPVIQTIRLLLLILIFLANIKNVLILWLQLTICCDHLFHFWTFNVCCVLQFENGHQHYVFYSHVNGTIFWSNWNQDIDILPTMLSWLLRAACCLQARGCKQIKHGINRESCSVELRWLKTSSKLFTAPVLVPDTKLWHFYYSQCAEK